MLILGISFSYRLKITPAIEALIKFAITPAIIARKPCLETNARFSGTNEPSPPINIAILEMFAKPHKANVTIACECSLS